MRTTLPEFSKININTFEKNLDTLLKKNIDTIDSILTQHTHFTWDNLSQPLENMNDALHQLWSPVQHLSAVMDSPALRETVRACLMKLSDYHTHLAHNEKLFHALSSIQNSKTFDTLSIAQQQSIKNDLRDFKLAGVHLPPAEKKQFAELTKTLSQLTQQFEEHILDATMAWKKHITDENELSGIPDHAKHAAKKTAEKENLDGWVFTLEAPDYVAVMTYADSEKLRHEMYYAYTTRASDCGPHAGKFDNSKTMHDITKTRFKIAKLLGFQNYAEYSLATKMVEKTEYVLTFLNELSEKSSKKAHEEFGILSQFAKNELGIEKLNAWDISYASEKLRQQAYSISPEDLRPYFPEPIVLSGLFDIIYKLYGVSIEKVEKDTWHPDVKCFQLLDAQKNTIAHMYFDLYARKNKRGGAWMDECALRRKLDDHTIQLPAAYLTCNFNSPIGNDPALFTHDDVETLFHECGHSLQHVLTKIDVANVSGIHNIPWDAVEIASQFFENWTWEKNAIGYITKHYQTGASLPDTLFNRMTRAKNFQSAMQMIRQLEFSIFDFRLHMEFNENDPHCIQSILNSTREKIALFAVPTFNRFQHSFAHIFSGGYAAGYYSYKWAEVMACDIFSLFKENGIFDQKTSKLFQETFLESGGARDPMDLFITFRGRKPTVDALLKQTGISA